MRTDVEGEVDVVRGQRCHGTDMMVMKKISEPCEMVRREGKEVTSKDEMEGRGR